MTAVTAEWEWSCQVIEGGIGTDGLDEIIAEYESHWGEGTTTVPRLESNVMLCGNRVWIAVNGGGYDSDDTREQREDAMAKAADQIGDGQRCLFSDPSKGAGGVGYIFDEWDGESDRCGAFGGTAQEGCNIQRC